MFDPKKFTTPAAKPLPVVLLLDVSSSMLGDKIDNLNKAVEDMLDAFAQEEKMETEIIVSVIIFGSQVDLHVPYTKASQVQWTTMQANGVTRMDVAFEMAKAMIEDKETTPSRAYRPAIVLVSDGCPTDEKGNRSDNWEKPLEKFISEGRSSKCDRMAMAIGRDADETVLKRFIEGTPHDLFYAENAEQLHEFFQRVTMTVTTRTRMKNPNVIPTPPEIKLDDGNVKPDTNGSRAEPSDDEGYW